MFTDIDVAGLIDRLQAHVLAAAPGTLTDAEVAAEIALLNKVMPDLVGIGLISAEAIRPVTTLVKE